MSVQLIRVEDTSDIDHVAKLAKEIWTEHFTRIIGLPQVEYMLAKFQNASAIRNQISNGYDYYLAQLETDYVGYIALVNNESKTMISKIYTTSASRGQGIGKAMLDFAESKCNSGIIWLTVNKQNNDSIEWYKRQGFSIKASIKEDIGEGFYMDDYIMEKHLIKK
ncbi:GNAT family N-acetyltransferase [Teredinibacter sp. KSP-S5-2]|uniref:GNAT family N-acetyltransferase n=1 Tax=Teredinibacter sp. KSP-S5-2 TaxID=3034506 RepID=UPI0029342541|nr:GNAT family N-acetyltransferase [Teredinibacter sp. KSP-S5-2]WNO09934.1 GNAT family N-acetyltransferase [Teredinibacter sp. KSP-S5-2]